MFSRATGNLHINIVAKNWDKNVEQTIEPWIYEATGTASFPFPLTSVANLVPSLRPHSAKRNGSISAEHGLGLMKAPYVGYSKPDPAIAVMQQIRRLFDPRGILSPGKYLPQASELPVEGEGDRVQ